MQIKRLIHERMSRLGSTRHDTPIKRVHRHKFKRYSSFSGGDL